MNPRPLLAMLIASSLHAGCSTSGATWLSEGAHERQSADDLQDFQPPERRARQARDRRTQRIAELEEQQTEPDEVARRVAVAKSEGSVVGLFRNTYYHFPSESEFSGEAATLYDAQCKAIKQVPRGFHDALCVQGSGLLDSGVTVSFAKRDCACALECPRTNQHICFDTLDKASFPWGRGATGKAITPLLTVAVDTDLIPLHTPIYIPEYAGIPRDAARSSFHDGCFVAQDRGLRVKGRHVDVFVGDTTTAKLWNRLVPSNQGVTVVVDSPRCRR